MPSWVTTPSPCRMSGCFNSISCVRVFGLSDAIELFLFGDAPFLRHSSSGDLLPSLRELPLSAQAIDCLSLYLRQSQINNSFLKLPAASAAEPDLAASELAFWFSALLELAPQPTAAVKVTSGATTQLPALPTARRSAAITGF